MHVHRNPPIRHGPLPAHRRASCRVDAVSISLDLASGGLDDLQLHLGRDDGYGTGAHKLPRQDAAR